MPWKNISGPPDFVFSAMSSALVPCTYHARKETFVVTVAKPIAGLYSPTDAPKSAVLNNAFIDGLNEILVGKQPVSVYDGLVHEWRANGGDTIRSEYEQAFHAGRV